jgi:hypothetical protein
VNPIVDIFELSIAVIPSAKSIAPTQGKKRTEEKIYKKTFNTNNLSVSVLVKGVVNSNKIVVVLF